MILPFKRSTRLLALLVLLLFLMGCAESAPYIRWHYVVPDGYQGFVAIHFECAGGSPLPMQKGTITVAFDEKGLYCTSDQATASIGPLPNFTNASGSVIPYVSDPYTYTGYAACCEDGTRVIGGNTAENPESTIIVRVQWVGYLSPRPSTEPEAPDDIELFIQDRFGLISID